MNSFDEPQQEKKVVYNSVKCQSKCDSLILQVIGIPSFRFNFCYAKTTQKYEPSTLTSGIQSSSQLIIFENIIKAHQNTHIY